VHGVVFDMDGVLIDSSAAHLEAWRRLGAETGVRFAEDVFTTTFGMHNRQIIPLWLGAETPSARVESLSVRKEEIFRSLVAAGAAVGDGRPAVTPIDGAVALIEALAAQGFALAVGSSGPAPNVRAVLELLGVAHHFRALSTGDDVSEGKPHPEVFLKAIDRLGLPAASCAVIEDAPQGIEAALAAGARVAALSSSYPRDKLKRAHLVVDSLRDLTPARVTGLIAGSTTPP
jgi:beta-phosphoglucomutase